LHGTFITEENKQRFPCKIKKEETSHQMQHGISDWLILFIALEHTSLNILLKPVWRNNTNKGHGS